MNPELRVLIEAALESLEGGQFQDFCLAFLPLYDGRFEGLARLGHNAAGKTRAGTPDLIKTTPDGRQIAVQCGTAQDYWPPEKSIKSSKPFRDAMKCVRKMSRLLEIVLITNRETPPDTPNVRAGISVALSRETSAGVTLLAREDIGAYLAARVDEPRLAALIAEYFPRVARTLVGQHEAAQNRILRQIARRRPIELRAALRVVDEAMFATTGVEEAAAYALEQAEALNTCRLRELPPFAGIIRPSVAALPLAEPFGRVWALTGVPKAGKTNALRQLATAWGDEKVLWFECPISENDTCSEEVGAAILQLVLPNEVPGPLSRSAARLEVALKHATTPTRTVIVVDNADRLSDAGLRRLAATLGILRRHGHLSQIACIFVAASGLHKLHSAADQIVTTPAWSIDELRELLSNARVAVESEAPERYLQTLEFRSGGHPLVALALARKCPQLADLVLSSLQPIPGLADEALSREVQQLLYADLLTDADAQNLVQRASLFIERIPPDVLDALRTAVSPHIATATSVLLHRLSPTVIEGTALDGYQVAFVFGEIAKQKVSIEEQQAVHGAAAGVLLRPIGKTLHADRICRGIFHSLLAGQAPRALMWTSLLGRAALDQNLPDVSINGLIDRLNLVRFLLPPVDLSGQLTHAAGLMTIGEMYARVGNHQTAADVFASIRLDADTSSAPDLAEAVAQFRLAVALGRATYLLIAGQPGARSVLGTLGERELATTTPIQYDVMLELLTLVVSRDGFGDGLPATLKIAVACADSSNPAIREAGVRLGATIGFAAALAQDPAVSLPGCFPTSPFGQMLQRVAEGTFAIQHDEVEEARARLVEAGDLARAQDWAAGPAWGELQGHLGDAAYSAGDRSAAIAAYSDARRQSSADSHMRWWSAWRLGVLQSDIAALTEAVDGLPNLGDTGTRARALGARGALKLKAGRDSEGLSDLAAILDAYYRDGDSTVGPAATAALAHLGRYVAAREGMPKADDDTAYPPFGAEPYDRVLSSWSPRVGPVIAFSVLGKAFRAMGKNIEARRYLTQAADATPQNDGDAAARPVAAGTLIGLLGMEPNDVPEIEARFSRLLTQPSGELNDRATAFLILGSEHLNGGSFTDPVRFERLLEGLTRGTAAGGGGAFWEAEIAAARACLAEAQYEDRGGITQLWYEALQKSVPDVNPRIMLRAGLALGFAYADHVTALRHVARFQFECLRGTELTGAVPDFLGNNLLRTWNLVRFSELSEKDLKPKEILFDSAHEMAAASTRHDTAAAAMVLALARLYEHHGPAVEWAEGRLQYHWDELPADTRSRILR